MRSGKTDCEEYGICKLFEHELKEARDWIARRVDCWNDLKHEDVDELSDEQVTRAIKKFFDGGIEEFKRCLV